MNLVNRTLRKLFNKRARDVSTRVLAAPLPVAEARNRAERREGMLPGWSRKYKRAVMALARRPRPDYPVLAHCIVGACKRLPRYRGMCYTHRLESFDAR